jgi:hypothetical protein
MKIIIVFILMIMIFSCSPKEKISGGDGAVSHGTNNDSLSILNAYINAVCLYSYDCDSLLMEPGELFDLVARFRTKEHYILEKEYRIGSYYGNFKCFVLGKDTLTVDKYHYEQEGTQYNDGFGNTEFLTSGDTLVLVRQYKYDLDKTTTSYQFLVSEKVFYFREGLLKTRTKTVKPWIGFYFKNAPFQVSNFSSTEELKRFRQELIELKNRYKINY